MQSDRFLIIGIWMTAWLIAIQLVLTPGLIVWLSFQEKELGYVSYEFGNFVLLGYFLGNLFSILLIGISLWYRRLFKSVSMALVAFQFITLALMVMGFYGMGWFIDKFAANP